MGALVQLMKNFVSQILMTFFFWRCIPWKNPRLCEVFLSMMDSLQANEQNLRKELQQSQQARWRHVVMEISATKLSFEAVNLERAAEHAKQVHDRLWGWWKSVSKVIEKKLWKLQESWKLEAVFGCFMASRFFHQWPSNSHDMLFFSSVVRLWFVWGPIRARSIVGCCRALSSCHFVWIESSATLCHDWGVHILILLSL